MNNYIANVLIEYLRLNNEDLLNEIKRKLPMIPEYMMEICAKHGDLNAISIIRQIGIYDLTHMLWGGASGGFKDICLRAIYSNLKLRIKNNYNDVLYRAAEEGHEEICNIFIELGANPGIMLSGAARNGHEILCHRAVEIAKKTGKGLNIIDVSLALSNSEWKFENITHFLQELYEEAKLKNTKILYRSHEYKNDESKEIIFKRILQREDININDWDLHGVFNSIDFTKYTLSDIDEPLRQSFQKCLNLYPSRSINNNFSISSSYYMTSEEPSPFQLLTSS